MSKKELTYKEAISVIQTALLCGQRRVDINGVEVDLKEYELSRDTQAKKEEKAREGAIEVATMIFS